MNKQEKELLTALFWYLQQNKNEHHALYHAKEALQSILKKEYSIARTLLRFRGLHIVYKAQTNSSLFTNKNELEVNK